MRLQVAWADEMSAGSVPASSGRFLLVRVDDRLLHGQVVFAWAQALSPRAYLIADDEVADDEWQREALQSVGSPDASVEVMSLDGFMRRRISLSDPAGTVVLLRGLQGLKRLAEAGFRPASGVNLGGLHARTGSRALLPYLHLTREDEGILLRLLEAGYPLYAQDLPSSPRYGPEKLRVLIGT